MRKVDESRVANYIRKHSNYKKWLAFVLCLSLLTGTITLYILNKPATAMTAEGAEGLGVMLETADDAYEQELIDQMNDDDEEEYGESEDSSDESSDDEEKENADDEEEYNESEDSSDESSDDEEKETADDLEDSLEKDEEAADLEDEEKDEKSLLKEKSEKTLSTDEKLAKLGVPESVDVAEYVTETIIEKKLEDGSWKRIDKEDLKEGDYIKVTFKYSIPEKAKLSEDIYLEIPEEFEKLETEVASLSGDDGTAELTASNQIKIEYDDSVKKNIIEDADIDMEDSEESSESDDEDLQASLSRKVVSFFKSLSLTVYAAGNDSVSVEGTYGAGVAKQQDSIELNPNWIDSVNVKLNPTELWEGGKFVGYDLGGSTNLNSGDTIPNGATVYFGVDYTIPAQTLCDKDGNLITDTVTFNIADKLKIDPKGDQYNPMVADVYRRKDHSKIGTITVKNGVATIKFEENFAKENKDEKIAADFFFAGSVNKSSSNVEEDITFTFNDKIEFKVRVKDEKKYDLNVEKTVNTESAGTNEAKYTIKIYSKQGYEGSGGEITLTDSFSFSSEEARKLFTRSQLGKITVTKNGSTVKTVTADGTDNGFSFTLPALAAGEEYLVTYTYNYTGMTELKQDTTVYNKAVAHTEGYGDKEGNAQFTIEGKLKKETPDIKKVFKSIDKNKKTVTWEIVVNSNNQPIAGYTLKDIITKSDIYGKEIIEYYTGPATISPKPGSNGNGSSEQITISGEQGYTFPKNAKATKYTITVTTPYNEYELIEGKMIYNRATIGDEEHHNNTPDIHSDIIETDIEPEDRVEKTAEKYTYSNRNAIIKWNIKAVKDIKCERTDEKGKKYWLYVDEIKGNQVITDDQLKSLESDLKTKGYEISVETGNKVLLAEREVTGYTGFSIYFYTEVKEGFSFSYETTGSIKNGNGQETFSNDSFVYSKTIGDSEDKVEYKPMLSKYDGNMNTEGAYNYDDEYLEGNGILSWIIKLEIPGDEKAKYGTLKIKEQLPDTVTALSEEEGGLRVGTSPDKDAGIAFSSGSASVDGVEFNHSGQEITFDGDAAKGKTFYFTVKAKINESEIVSGAWADGTVRKSFENKVVLIDKDGGEIQWAAETTDINLLGDVVRKGQLVLNDASKKQQEIEYEVEINKGAEDLLQGGDVLTLKDTLRAIYKDECFNAYLKDGSLAVYEIDNATGTQSLLSADEYSVSISDTDITQENYGDYWNHYAKFCNIEFKLPDKKHIKIVYTYEFERLEKVGDNTSVYDYGSIHVNNIAVLEGVSKSNTSDEKEAEIKVYRIGAHADTVGAHFNKVDYLDASKLLPGGKYTLWKYVPGSSTTADIFGDVDYQPVYLKQTSENVYSVVDSGDNDNSFTTTNGACSFDKVDRDVAYRIVEEKAPEGYTIGTPLYFVFESAVGSTKVLPASFKEKGGKTYAAGTTIVLTNVKEGTTSLTVKKEWVKADATKASIQFKLAKRKSHIAATYNYYSVDVYYRRNNKLVAYRGYPSVREGSTLQYSIPKARGVDTNVTVNGNTTSYAGSAWEGNAYSTDGDPITINGNTTVIIELNYYQDDLDYSLTTSIRSSDDTQNEDNDSKDTIEIGTYPLTEENGWKWTFTDLPKSYVDEQTGEKYEWLYFVEEVSHNSYYDVTYTENNLKGINQGVITITNTRNELEGYELPRTGGVGELPYMAVGAGLAGIALVGEKVVRRRKKKDEDPA